MVNRLPEVARSFGKNFLDLKKSIQGIREELEATARDATNTVTRSIEKPPSSEALEATAPKFEPPPSETVPETH